MTAKDAAARLGCSPQWIVYLCATGRIKAVKHGWGWWIEDADLPATLADVPKLPMGRPPAARAAREA